MSAGPVKMVFSYYLGISSTNFQCLLDVCTWDPHDLHVAWGLLITNSKVISKTKYYSTISQKQSSVFLSGNFCEIITCLGAQTKLTVPIYNISMITQPLSSGECFPTKHSWHTMVNFMKKRKRKYY